MSKQKEQTLSEYLDEFAKVEVERIAKAQENFPKWLASRDKTNWTIKTKDTYKRIWSPGK